MTLKRPFQALALAAAMTLVGGAAFAEAKACCKDHKCCDAPAKPDTQPNAPADGHRHAR